MSEPGHFHQVYRDTVLHPDFRFARLHLWQHFLDAMTAHVLTVRELEDPRVASHLGDVDELLAAIKGLRDQPLPDYDPDVPDLYFAFNARLEAALGREPVSFLRMGLSRNDLDMAVYKMRSRELLLEILQHLCRLRGALQVQAQAHLETLLIAQTHHQPGQPTTVAHYLGAIDNALARDSERLLEGYARLNTCPLGAAALAGSSHKLDRHLTARLLGFERPVSNSYDAVAAADWQVEFMGCLQNVALNLSRFVCDLIIWAADGRFRLPDTLVQGSSIMPQKRNPVALEHARTRLSRTLGSSQMVLYSSHNIPYADLNDFGPDIQGALVSIFIQIDGALALLTASLEEGSFRQAQARRAGSLHRHHRHRACRRADPPLRFELPGGAPARRGAGREAVRGGARTSGGYQRRSGRPRWPRGRGRGAARRARPVGVRDPPQRLRRARPRSHARAARGGDTSPATNS